MPRVQAPRPAPTWWNCRDRLLNPFLEHRLADIAKDHAQKKLRRLAPVVERAAALQLPIAQTQLRNALAGDILAPSSPGRGLG
jgi:mannitol-1-phosphate/altronate dehydrogenase